MARRRWSWNFRSEAGLVAPMPQLSIPRLLTARIDRLARDLVQPPAGPQVDFAQPAGEEALLAADSVSWQVFKNPVTLFIGGVAAVLLELGEPRVRHGVWDHSSFRTRPMERLQRTGLAAMLTVYGPASQARAMILGVNRAHGKVAGTTSAGASYRADDPELLDWVQATAAWGFMEAYAAFARPLSLPQRDSFFAEGAPIARLYGATGAPTSTVELGRLFARMLPKLEPSDTLQEFLAIMREVPALPRAGRPLQRLLIKAAVAILPPGVADRLDIAEAWRLSAWERQLAAALAKAADRLVLPSSPAVQSCRRLGLPDDYLYR